MEKVIEEYTGRTLSKLILRGNKTLAVGLLVNEAFVKLSGGKYLQIAITSLDKEEISRLYGKEDNLDELYGLIVRGNIGD